MTVPASPWPQPTAALPLASSACQCVWLCSVRLNGIYVLRDVQSQPVFLKQLTNYGSLLWPRSPDKSISVPCLFLWQGVDPVLN